MVGVKPLIRCASESEDIMSQLEWGWRGDLLYNTKRCLDGIIIISFALAIKNEAAACTCGDGVGDFYN